MLLLREVRVLHDQLEDEQNAHKTSTSDDEVVQSPQRSLIERPGICRATARKEKLPAIVHLVLYDVNDLSRSPQIVNDSGEEAEETVALCDGNGDLAWQKEAGQHHTQPHDHRISGQKLGRSRDRDHCQIHINA